jgi:NADH-quinone oxidoreductase subunit N
MIADQFSTLAPEMLLCGAGCLVLLLEAFAPRLRVLFTPLSLVALLAAGYAAWQLPAGTSFNGQLEAGPWTFAFSAVVLVSALLALAASDGFLHRVGIFGGEYHALFLWCVVGLLLMIRARELLTIFVALELLSLCLYSLAGFHRANERALESAIKYFLMGAFVSAFILLGIGLLYGQTGSTYLVRIAGAFASGTSGGPLAMLGILLMLAGFGFKMSLVPFHAWSPDTYQGAPSPFVGFLSVAPKAASVLVMIRLLETVAGGALGPKWPGLIAGLAVASMVVGNLLALVQRDIKRMLAYSGIAHMGYLLIALVDLDGASRPPVLVYLLAYALMNAGAFAVITLLYDRPGDQHLISDLAGFGYRYPLLAACLAISMLSLGGIPPTAGFLGKYLVFLHAVETGNTWLAVVGVVASLVGVYYYLRVIYTLYMKPATRPADLALDGWGRLAAVLAAAGTLIVGLLPGPLLSWIIDVVGLSS